MKSIRVNLAFAGRFIAERVLHELLSYVHANPDVNLPRLLNTIRRFVPEEKHRVQIAKVLDAYRDVPGIRDYVNRLFSLHDNVKRRLIFNWFVNAQFLGVPQHRRIDEDTGVHVPNFILIDPTSACNLRCKGCWAGEYAKHDTLELELVDRIVREAKELGIYWIVMSGGEPFLWPHLIELAGRHSDVAFMLYTNGTLIDDAMADRLLEAGNVSPAISLEGWKANTDARRGAGVFDRVTAAMARLRERGLAFGISLTMTRENVEEVTGDDFIDFLVEQGAMYGWSFHYIPIGRDPNPDMMVTPEQRKYLVNRIDEIRMRRGFPIADFWNDGELTRGCIAGGRRYFHITASGDVEPCAFVHITTHNIRDMSLSEVLRTPLFKAFQRRQPFSDNLLRACPIIDVPQKLRDICAETGALPSHPGAGDFLLPPLADELDARAWRWGEVADEIWEERHPSIERVGSGV